MNATTQLTKSKGSSQLLVTPEQAEFWLTNYKYSGQKPMRPHHINYLASEMRNSTFVPGTAIHFVLCGDKEILINGHHTLSALVQNGTPYLLTVIRTEADTLEAVDRLYFRLDTGLKRTHADALSAFRMTERTNLDSCHINILAAIVQVLDRKFKQKDSRNKMNPDRLVELVQDWAPLFHTYLSYIKGCPKDLKNPLLRSSTSSVALATIKHNQNTELTKEFWRQVAQDDGIATNDPRKILNKWLLVNFIKGGGAVPHHRTTDRAATKAVALAWNAFYDGRQIKQIRIPNPVGPIVITGTPYGE